MNRKIILLPLVLSALVLAGCGETGTSSTTSSEEATSSTSSSQAGETTSSVEESESSSESSTPEQQTWNTIEQLKGLAQGTSFTARAYWMGTCGMINEEFGTYNTSYVADGTNGYIIYRAEATKIDALSLEPGKTIVEFTGTISNYVDKDTGEVKTYECSLDTIKVIDDATGLTAPVMLTLNAANPTFTFDATTASRRIAISDAKVVSNESGNYGNVTVTFTVGTDTTKYTIFFDSRYTDTSLVADLKAGDTFSCESFVGSSRFESIDKLVITSEGGSTEEPGDETITPLADVIKMADDTTFTTRAYYVGRNSKAAEKGIMTYNAVYVADGATAYMIYNHSQEEIDALNLVPGESIVEFSGKVDNFGGLYECRADSIKVITDATGLEAPVYQTLDKDHADIDLESVLVSTKFNVSDATVKNIATSGNDTTITFTVGEGTKEYTLLLDQRYNDMTPVENLAVGDAFETETFLNVEDGEKVFTYIANFVDKTEGGSTEEPDPETPTISTIASLLETGAALDDNLGTSTETYRLKGNVTAITDRQFTVTDETGSIIVYGDPTEGEGDVHMKDTVTLEGKLQNYYDTIELVEWHVVEMTRGTYDVTVLPCENGEIQASKSTGIAYDEEITLTAVADNGYKIASIKVNGVPANIENNVVTVKVQGDIEVEAEFVTEDTEILQTMNLDYVFSKYEAGKQYAENEAHVLDEYTTVTTTKCHFTSELRIYSSSTNNGFAIISCTNVIAGFRMNAGNKVDTLNVYGSVDGAEYTLIKGIEVTTSSYTDYTLDIDHTLGYKYLKLDVAGSQQIRLKTFGLTVVK